MGKGVTVDVLHTSLVKPASPSPQPFLSLSPCDLMWRDYTYNRRLLFYHRPLSTSAATASCCGRVDDVDDYPRFITTLQTSLSQALTFFYPLAGRLVERRCDTAASARAGDEAHEKRLTVACNDEGAELVQARIEGVSFAELQSSNFDMQPYFVQLTRWASYTRLQEGAAPLLSIQVTRFSCGSIVMGIAHSHVVADGFSLWHFMSSWVECAKGQPLSLQPSHDRTPLILQTSWTSPEAAESAVVLDWIEDVEGKAKQCSTPHTTMKTTSGKDRQHVVSFSREIVGELKRKVNNKYGSYEVLCAHLWRKAAKAAFTSSNNAGELAAAVVPAAPAALGADTRTSFCSVVNMRVRMEPPLAEGYFGCALLWGKATATVGELEDEKLAATAARIRAAVRSCTSSRMHQFIHFLEHYGKDAFLPKIVADPLRLRVSSSPKFPMLSTDFGWGGPVAVRSALVEENGKLVLYPGPSGLGSCDICLSFPSPIMGHLY
ncbi:hypothetical protein L7F22_034025 [Adiantum nelumboides]|nr:hypothetical protein [Adiantum nelumboides]